MVDYMSLEEQVGKDFERARRRAFVGRLIARLRRDPRGSGMVAFDEVRRSARADNRFYRGKRIVEVSKIAGSVGRHREFDGRFMPTKASASKWKRVDRAFRRGVDLPPVSLYKIGDSYFVHDGNHRGWWTVRLRRPEWRAPAQDRRPDPRQLLRRHLLRDLRC